MKYYKEAGVNPFAACLPLVLQLPVFISLVYMLRTDLQAAHLQRGRARPTHLTSRAEGARQARLLADPGAHTTASFLFVHDITSKATGVALIVLIGAVRRRRSCSRRDDVGRQRRATSG